MNSEKSAWGYVRISQESDASLDEQKESIRRHARENDLSLQTTRNDGKKTSGFDNDRHEYRILCSKIESGEIDAVITRDRARLSRDFDERLRLITEFRDKGVEWHVTEAGGKLDLGDTETAGMECLHAMMDHVKKKVEIERSKKAVEKRLEKGYDHGTPPFGYTFGPEKKYFVPDEESGDFETALDIIRLRENGESWYSISDDVGVARSTARRVVDRKEKYIEDADQLEPLAGDLEVEG